MAKLVRVRDLPYHTSGSFLYCRACGEHYSADAGDYFMAKPDTVMKCCDEPMILATEHRSIVEVR